MSTTNSLGTNSLDDELNITGHSSRALNATSQHSSRWNESISEMSVDLADLEAAPAETSRPSPRRKSLRGSKRSSIRNLSNSLIPVDQEIRLENLKIVRVGRADPSGADRSVAGMSTHTGGNASLASSYHEDFLNDFQDVADLTETVVDSPHHSKRSLNSSNRSIASGKQRRLPARTASLGSRNAPQLTRSGSGRSLGRAELARSGSGRNLTGRPEMTKSASARVLGRELNRSGSRRKLVRADSSDLLVNARPRRVAVRRRGSVDQTQTDLSPLEVEMIQQALKKASAKGDRKGAPSPTPSARRSSSEPTTPTGKSGGTMQLLSSEMEQIEAQLKDDLASMNRLGPKKSTPIPPSVTSAPISNALVPASSPSIDKERTPMEGGAQETSATENERSLKLVERLQREENMRRQQKPTRGKVAARPRGQFVASRVGAFQGTNGTSESS